MTQANASQQQNNAALTEKEVIANLVNALHVLIDTPKSGPRSAGTWNAAESQALEAISLATSLDQQGS